MQVLLLREVGLKTPIQAKKLGLGEFHPLNGEQSHQDPQKALPCVESHHMLTLSVRT